MKKRKLQLMNFSLLIFLLFAFQIPQNAQAIFYEDFEQPCPGMEGISFFTGCIPGWISTHGTPDNKGINFPAYSGDSFAHVGTRFVPDFCPETPVRGEGFALSDPNIVFEADKTYKISYALFGKSTTASWVLTDGLINTTGAGNCDPDEEVPPIPAGSQIINGPQTHSNFNIQEWTFFQAVFQPTKNYSQLWFRATIEGEGNDNLTGSVYIDAVKVELVKINYDCVLVEDFHNGGFESEFLPEACEFINDNSYTLRIPDAMFQGCVPSWQTANATPDLIQKFNTNTSTPGFPYEGERCAALWSHTEFSACSNEAIFHNYDFDPNKTYQLSFYHRAAYDVQPPIIPSPVIVALTEGLENDHSIKPCDSWIPNDATILHEDPAMDIPVWTQVTTAPFKVEDGKNQIAFIPQKGPMPERRIWLIDKVELFECACSDDDFVLDFQFEDADGNVRDEFCPGEEIFFNDLGSTTEEEYFLEILQIPLNIDGTPNLDQITGCNSWDNTSPVGLFNLGDKVIDLNCFPVEDIVFIGGEFGYRYEVKLADKDQCDEWRSLKKTFTVLPDKGALDINLENVNGEVKGRFCVEEDVFLNAETTNASEYQFSIYDFTAGAYIYDSGWVPGTFATTNLSALLAQQSTFLSTGYYYVLFSIKGECFDPLTTGAPFFIECCDGGLEVDAYFFPDSDGNGSAGSYTITADDYELYEQLNATHVWYLLSSPNPDGGPYTSVYTTTGDAFSYDNAQGGLYYFVIHQVITDCGQTCYGARLSHSDSGTDGNGCELCNEINCDLITTYWNGKDPITGDPRSKASSAELSEPAATIFFYPNPAQDFINLVNPIDENLDIQILDITGKNILNLQLAANASQQMDVSSLSTGTYIFSIVNNDGTFRQMEKVLIIE